jgi:hypothetical protein
MNVGDLIFGFGAIAVIVYALAWLIAIDIVAEKSKGPSLRRNAASPPVRGRTTPLRRRREGPYPPGAV